MQAVGAQPVGDGLPDTGTAAGYDSGFHAQASAIKNRPSDYENRTLALRDPARQYGSLVRTGETFGGGLSHR
ncbi:MAG: hypothetical protein NVS4B6_22970 [Mycobacterium sp.]